MGVAVRCGKGWHHARWCPCCPSVLCWGSPCKVPAWYNPWRRAGGGASSVQCSGQKLQTRQFRQPGGPPQSRAARPCLPFAAPCGAFSERVGGLPPQLQRPAVPSGRGLRGRFLFRFQCAYINGAAIDSPGAGGFPRHSIPASSSDLCRYGCFGPYPSGHRQAGCFRWTGQRPASAHGSNTISAELFPVLFVCLRALHSSQT